MNHMTKQEALDQIAKLQQYVASIPDKPDICNGQVWQQSKSARYIVTKASDEKRFTLVRLGGTHFGNNTWANDRGFGKHESEFTYVGMFDEVYKAIK
jgi:hypothetical protein